MARAEFSVSVTAHPLPERSDPARGVHAFAYRVRIVNTGAVTAQLVGREWLIHDAAGATQTVRGLAVVGRQPLLQPGDAHEYTSWVQLATPTGRMQGRFFCVTEAVEFFEAPIAPFELSHAAPGPASQAAQAHPGRPGPGPDPDEASPRVLH